MERREYQVHISEAASKSNTLVVLPTGLGKTVIAILVAEKRLSEIKDSTIVVLAPTRPLVIQHYNAFRNYFKNFTCNHMTGQIPAKQREKTWTESSFIFATPQVIANDVEAKRYTLTKVGLLVFDEAHRCVKNYDYTKLALEYQRSAEHPLILGLTASPGGDRKRVEEICQNLSIKQVEARTEHDDDVRSYVQSVSAEWIRVQLPENYREVSRLLRTVYDEKLNKLKTMKLLPNIQVVPKKLLLDLRLQLVARLRENRSGYIFAALTLQAQTISLLHAIELLETQGAGNLRSYLARMKENPKRTVQSLLKDERIQRAVELSSNLTTPHPKLDVASKLVISEIGTNPNARIIIFTQYRDTVDQIVSRLQQEGIRPVRFVGQATRDETSKGLTQNEQVEILKDFSSGTYNVLVTTSIGEEGLHVPDVDHVIFFEAVPSEIRTIQRRGRTGRTRIGKVTTLLAENTVDEPYYWSSFRKEKRMRTILHRVKTGGMKTIKKKTTLLDYT
ncbi:MAG: DEAD/DEAH box helicase [Candidatus Bathyarchaeia archaeon]